MIPTINVEECSLNVISVTFKLGHSKIIVRSSKTCQITLKLVIIIIRIQNMLIDSKKGRLHTIINY